VDDHCRQCAQCAQLIADSARLGRGLAATVPCTQDDLNVQLAAIESRIAGERGLRAFLRSRPTRWRFGACVALAAALLTRELLRTHVPLRELGASRLLAGVSLLSGLALIAHSALRPMPLQGSAARRRSLFAFAAWALPCMLWLAPETHAGAEDFSGGGFALHSLSCFGYGSALAAPSFALLWAFDRSESVPYRVWALAAGSVSLLSALLLLVHCPSTEFFHLITGHFSIGLVWFSVVSSAYYWHRFSK